MNTRTRLRRLLPFLVWFPMSGVQVRADILAGITVALVLIPQSMAYAQLAGMPPYFGLYAAFLPVLVGALWGSSRQLSTGPVAVVSLLTASSLAPMAAAGSGHYIALAVLLAFMVGVIQLSLGLLRLGTIVNLLSHPVIIGFTNAAAIIIALSQLNKLLGVPMARSDVFLSDVAHVLMQIGDTHVPTLVMGVSALVLMLLLRRFLPRWPNVLIAVALATLVSYYTGFDRQLQVPADTVRNVQAYGLIQDYFSHAARIAELESEIGQRREALRNTEKSAERRWLVTQEHELELVELLRDAAVRENRERFRALAHIRFLATEEADGAIALYAETDPAATQVTGETRWRVRKLEDGGLRLNGGGEVIGTIPSGLPSLTLPRLSWADITTLISAALVMALVAFMEAISIAKAMAAKTRTRVDPSQELIGQGLANIAGSFSQSFPVSGSFSRSAVNLNAGAVTGLSSVVAGLLVLLTLLFLTGLLYHLPQAVLAAVIMMAVFGLINIAALRHAWQTHRHDGIAATATFVMTLAFAPHLDMGILFGALVAIALYLRRRMRPRTEILGQLPDGVLAGMDTYGLSPISDRIVPVRFDGELTFVNVAYFEDMMLEALARFPEAKAILLIGSSINEIDVSGEEKIRAIAEHLEKAGVTLYISGLKRQVRDVLERAHISSTIPPERIFKSKELALRTLLERYG
jgi:sulfate permease, SulP family